MRICCSDFEKFAKLILTEFFVPALKNTISLFSETSALSLLFNSKSERLKLQKIDKHRFNLKIKTDGQ
ncbi:unnamed protein product [Blepharisma stoltei]|uniref:Uncharacterized protein n=1 Tax=Blepharisma stoltei TaxID=1481888 RepID=A0AAU9JL03_9CILI|nr:unnamed protein product [Blepharisma stoltei]